MAENWAGTDAQPLAECLRRIAHADIVIVIFFPSYGWVPPGQPEGAEKSITWLECEEAIRLGKPLLVFIVDDTHPWPVEYNESYALTRAVAEGKATPELLGTTQRNICRLGEFKTWLMVGRICAFFTTPEDLRGRVEAALRQFRDQAGRRGPNGKYAQSQHQTASRQRRRSRRAKLARQVRRHLRVLRRQVMKLEEGVAEQQRRARSRYRRWLSAVGLAAILLIGLLVLLSVVWRPRTPFDAVDVAPARNGDRPKLDLPQPTLPVRGP
jgi:hypothetical protein